VEKTLTGGKCFKVEKNLDMLYWTVLIVFLKGAKLTTPSKLEGTECIGSFMKY
jgi:hypothetical protein